MMFMILYIGSMVLTTFANQQLLQGEFGHPSKCDQLF